MSITSIRLDTSSAPIRTFHHSEFPLERILAAKGSTTVSVCLPARNEEATVGAIVSVLRDELLARGAIDEIVVELPSADLLDTLQTGEFWMVRGERGWESEPLAARAS